MKPRCGAVITKTMEAMAANRAGQPWPKCSRAAWQDGLCYQHHPSRPAVVAAALERTKAEVAAMFARHGPTPARDLRDAALDELERVVTELCERAGIAFNPPRGRR